MTGSTFYVNHSLSPILNAKPKPKFIGAIILDAVMNYNRSKNSQVLPSGFDKVNWRIFHYSFAFLVYFLVGCVIQSFPEAYDTVVNKKNVGNYVNMIVNEKLKSGRLDNLFSQQWLQADPTKRFSLMELDIRRESSSRAVIEFLRQDHIAFWNHKSNGVNDPLPAVLITDTGIAQYLCYNLKKN